MKQPSQNQIDEKGCWHFVICIADFEFDMGDYPTNRKHDSKKLEIFFRPNPPGELQLEIGRTYRFWKDHYRTLVKIVPTDKKNKIGAIHKAILRKF